MQDIFLFSYIDKNIINIIFFFQGVFVNFSVSFQYFLKRYNHDRILEQCACRVESMKLMTIIVDKLEQNGRRSKCNFYIICVNKAQNKLWILQIAIVLKVLLIQRHQKIRVKDTKGTNILLFGKKREWKKRLHHLNMQKNKKNKSAQRICFS